MLEMPEWVSMVELMVFRRKPVKRTYTMSDRSNSKNRVSNISEGIFSTNTSGTKTKKMVQKQITMCKKEQQK